MEEDIDDILLKYVTNQDLSKTEIVRLKNWANGSVDNKKALEEIKKYWYHKKNTNEDSKERVWKKLKSNLLKTPSLAGNIEVKNKKNMTKQHLLVAASLLFILLSIVFVENTLTSGSEKIASELEKTAWVTRENKKGEKRTFRLSDGTTIKLNADSKISFPEKFGQEKREVFLQGEAFFDVKRDTARPFLVHSGKVTTIVKGTSFNIEAYPEAYNVKVSVATGQVEVVETTHQKRISLQPMERAVYDYNHRQLGKETYGPEELAWKDGIIVFSNAELGEIIKELERWYGVKFNIKNRNIFINEGYTGSFKNEPLSTVLETISFAGRFEFAIEENQVTIK